MVSIQYGGGPSLEQRQSFCNLRPGSHIPGYLGFVPQLKFQNGGSYGKETHDCSKKLPYYSGPKAQKILHFTPQIGKTKESQSRLLFHDEVPVHRLPKPTGDNKYTEKMMPGYSGDIPRYLNKFGGTYRSICDECVDEFIYDYERNTKKAEKLEEMAGLFPRLRPIQGDPRVRDHMNLWSDCFIGKNGNLLPDRRPLTEPPMPGYSGFIPRMNNTELGLGARYNHATKRCLESFDDENKTHFRRLHEKMKVKDVSDVRPLTVTAPSDTYYSRRLFHQNGIIPAYTGHIHREKEQIGNTVGDTTRSLDVCKHDFSCYGEYVKNKDLAVH